MKLSKIREILKTLCYSVRNPLCDDSSAKTFQKIMINILPTLTISRQC